MFSKLPLASLRAFESAARLGGFKAAADELCVTPAAISYQIKNLEEWLGVLLFERSKQGVKLTADGAQLQTRINKAFIDISRGLESIQPVTDKNVLTLSTTPAFAALWLIPRLGAFYEQHPHIRVRVETSNNLVDLLRDSSIDMAIRCSFKDFPELFQAALMDEYFCAYAPAQSLSERKNSTFELIDVRWDSPPTTVASWKQWCAAAQHEDWLNQAILREYDDEHFALQAAISGHGLVLASTVLAADSVAKGLLKPYRPDIKLPGARYLAVCAPGRERRSPVKEFLTWLMQEVGLPTSAVHL